MKITSYISYVALLGLATFSSCKKGNLNGALENTGNFTDTTGALKDLASFPIGFAVEYPLASGTSPYWATVKREGASVTFGNEMKNSSLVRSDGTFDFTTADNFYTLATNNGLQVFGHTLVWHSQQRATYYNSLIGGGTSGPTVTNLVVNPGFETSATNGDIAEGWQSLNGGTQFAIATGTNANSGTKALQANVPAGGQNYNTQIITRTAIPVTAGKTYTISYFIKGTSAQNIQFELRTSAATVNYQGGKPVTTSYAKVIYDYLVPVGVTSIQLAFDLGGTANTIYIDDVSITDASVAPPPSNTQLAAIVDREMEKHISTVVGHYAGKVKAWDVLNEPFTDGGAELRNNTNTPSEGRNDVFVWQNYLGRGYAAKAFQYAKAADPTADLYMNDYNLESNAAKLAAFVTLANELKTANAGITGVGTQMHIEMATADYGKIAASLQQLASTGLKVRISELDIRVNSINNTFRAGFVQSALNIRLQAAMFKFVVDSYLKYVPPAQRGGITLWGVHDPDSWFNNSTRSAANIFEYPLLFDNNYAKKAAYAAVKQALQSAK